MGGPSKAFKKLVNKAVKQKVIKKVEPKPKSVEQPKVKSQMDNSDIKSKDIMADKLANNRRGRRRTIMTSVTGVEEYPTLDKKTLLGG
jgi:hypothetical protein